MTTFRDGDFIFQIIDTETCRVGTVMTSCNTFATGANSGSSYQGPAKIPSFAHDASTDKKYKVIETSYYCFRGCSSLKEVVLPDTLRTINCDSFWGTIIAHLTIPASVTIIKEFGLSCMYSLTSLVFERGSKLEQFDNKILYSAHSLTNVVLPPSLKSIGANIFDSSSAASISVIYCGSNDLSQSGSFSSPSTVNVYVTSIYPANTNLGGKTPSLINNNLCDLYKRNLYCPSCGNNYFKLPFLFMAIIIM